MHDRSTRTASDRATDHVHPFWCTQATYWPDDVPNPPHDQHVGRKIYVELQDYDALATLALAQLDWRDEGAEAADDLKIRLRLKSRALVQDAEAYMSITEAKALRDALSHRITEAEHTLSSDREHSRGWALGAGARIGDASCTS